MLFFFVSWPILKFIYTTYLSIGLGPDKKFFMTVGLRSRATGNRTSTWKPTNGVTATGVEFKPYTIERTDLTLWRLKVKHGRQTWHYITPEQAKDWPQSIPEKYHLGLETVS